MIATLKRAEHMASSRPSAFKLLSLVPGTNTEIPIPIARLLSPMWRLCSSPAGVPTIAIFVRAVIPTAPFLPSHKYSLLTNTGPSLLPNLLTPVQPIHDDQTRLWCHILSDYGRSLSARCPAAKVPFER